MTLNKLATGAAGAVVIMLAGTAYAAHGEGGYACQTWNPTKSAPAVTHCVTWTRQAAARLAAAACDPAKMAPATMRDACARFMAHPEPLAAS